MNKYLKSFLHRGLIFGGFGPIVTGIIYLILSLIIENFSLDGVEMFTAIISTYILAFIHAGASVFNQIESWSIAKSLLCHLATLYAAYTACYLLNSWIPFDWRVLAIFTAIFIAVYLVIWFSVFVSVKLASRKFNSKLG